MINLGVVSLGEHIYNLGIGQQLDDFSLALFEHLELTWTLLGDDHRFCRRNGQQCLLMKKGLHVYVDVRFNEIEINIDVIAHTGVQLHHRLKCNYHEQWLGNVLTELAFLGHTREP